MSAPDHDEARAFWDRVATDWRIQVGDDGDSNRRMNSDPVLWRLAGDVAGRVVLDAGCGTGYLSRKLVDAGAKVVGVDFSARMIEIARSHNPGIDFRVDSCTELSTLDDAHVDLVIANYVLMDVADLEAATTAFARVLKPGGTAVVIFSHPCFVQGRARDEAGGVAYVWEFSYFERRKVVDPPWAHFTSPFIWFHRPLSDYWKAFASAGFAVEDFEEPRITPERHHLCTNPAWLEKCRTRPYSVAFKLRKR